jgi:hypothetical protein
MMLKTFLTLGTLIIASASPAESNVCRTSILPSQRKDAETITRLEKAWLTAEYRGDDRFLACLLDPEYHVIVAKKGEIRTRADLLDRVAKSKGGSKSIPALTTTVAISGSYATAHSSMTAVKESGESFTASYVDFYKFEDGRWIALAGVDL